MQNIILLHGALGCKQDLEPLATELKTQDFNPFILGFSGHGDVDFQNRFTIPQFAAELKAFITDKQLKQPAVFGYSMGGYVALYTALHDPEVTGNIVTLATKMNWDPITAQKESRKLDPDQLSEKAPAFVQALNKTHGNKWQELLKRTGAMMLDIAEHQYLNESNLKNIAQPVMMGLGDKDSMVSVEETRATFGVIPSSRMFMLPGTRHPLETADPVLLAAHIKNFVKPGSAQNQ